MDINSSRNLSLTLLAGIRQTEVREVCGQGQQGAGKASAQLAKVRSEQEFNKFQVLDDQRFESDFDRMVKQLPEKKP